MERYYNVKKKTVGSAYDLNDMVKLKNYGKTKFKFSWKGPYVVVGFGIIPGTYHLMDMRGCRLDYAIAQDNLAPWRSPLGSNADYRYDPTPRESLEPASVAVKSCEGITDQYKSMKKKIGIPIKVPRND